MLCGTKAIYKIKLHSLPGFVKAINKKKSISTYFTNKKGENTEIQESNHSLYNPTVEIQLHYTIYTSYYSQIPININLTFYFK